MSGQKIVSMFQARKIAQQEATKQLEIDIQCLKDYEMACKSSNVTADTFTNTMGKASKQAQDYATNIKEGTGSSQVYAESQRKVQSSLKATSTASQAASIGVKALSVALNMFAGMAIAWGISKVIEGIEYLTTTSERAIEKTKELQDEISQISSDYNSERQALEGLKEEYGALTSKIGKNGAEASLSADEYERYRDITSEILDITPKLITGWDDEGRAISDKNDLLQQSIDLLDEEYQKSLRNVTTKAQNETIAAGIIAQKEEYDNDPYTKTVNDTTDALVNGFINDLKQIESEGKADEYKLVETMWQYLDPKDYAENYNNFWYDGIDTYEQLRDLIDKVGYDTFAESFSNEDNPIFQYFSDEQVDELIRSASEYFQQLELVEDKEDEIFQQYKDQLNLNAQAVGDAYLGLDEQTKAGITQMIDSFDYNDMTKEKFSDMATDLKDFVGKLSTDDTLRSYINNLFKPMGGDESIEDYETRVKTGIDEITSYCENNYPAIKLSFGDIESDVEALKLKYNTAISNFTGNANDVDLGKFFEDNSINDESEIDYWNKVTDGAKSASEAVEMYNKVKSETPNNDTISFTDTISQVQSLTEGLDKLDQIYADVLDKESFDWSSILNNKGFKETFGGLGAAYDDFIKTISNSPNDIDACQSAFDNLATAYIQNSDALSGLTEETKQASIAMLEEMGIKNAEEVVTSILIQKEGELAAQKILAANSTYTLTNLTTAEIDRLLTEGIVTEQTSKQLAIFALQKQLSNNYRIETQEDVNRIYNLAQMAGIGAEALARFAQFKNDLENETDPRTRSWIVKSINGYKETLFSELNDVKNSKFEIPEVSYGGGSATKSALDNANKAAEDNKVKFKEILDKYLELYKAELDAGLIDFKTFLNKSRSLLDEYYRDGKISGKEYWDYIGNLQKERLSVYDKVLPAVTKLYDDEIDKINDIIDGLEKQNDALKDQLEQYDNVLGVVDKVYESEIDRIREQQDAIDETISKLQDENDEKQRAIELEKARYQLYRALNNRTVKLYNGKEYIYTHDSDEVRDAQQNLADLELEETVAGLEKEKEAINDVIAELEKYREMWKEISSAKEDEEYKQLAIAIWGKDYEKIILSNRITDIDSFKDKYIHIQQQIEDNQGLIDSYNEKIEYYEALKEAWNSVATAREESINREMAAQTLGANWENDVLNGRMDVLNNFKNMYIATQQAIVDAAWNAANAQIAALNAVKAAESTKSPTSGGSSGSVSSSVSNKPNKPNKKPSHSNSGGGGNSNLPSMQKYGTGTNNAKPGTHIVAEDGKEIIRTNDGEMFLAENEQPFRFEGGETVINNSETTTLLENLGNYKPVDFAEFTGSYGNKFKIRQTDLTALFDLSMNRINTSLHNSTPVRNDNTSSINIGDIHLHEVQNVDGLAKAIIRELPGKVNQAMYGK